MKHYPNADDTDTCVKQIDELRAELAQERDKARRIVIEKDREIARLREARRKIKARIKEFASDSRLKEPALVDINAPLALIQCSIGGQLQGLRLALKALEARP